MTQITLDTYRETREQLKASLGQLEELRKECITGDSDMLARVELQMAQITALKEKFIEQREALSTVLPDGTKLWPGQYEALERFAENNELGVRRFLRKITVEEGVITKCAFEHMNLITLEGLQGLSRLKALNVSENPQLTSLRGIPKQAIEEIIAYSCSLTGDLSEISGANKLRVLQVYLNKGLTSLKGIPTQAIEEIFASYCGLTGNLSALTGADTLRRLYVRDVKGLTSLKGTPMQAIEEIGASDCNLAGNHNFLSKAPNLQYLDLENNRRVTLDESKFDDTVWIRQ